MVGWIGGAQIWGGKEKHVFGKWGMAGAEETRGVERDENQEDKLRSDRSRGWVTGGLSCGLMGSESEAIKRMELWETVAEELGGQGDAEDSHAHIHSNQDHEARKQETTTHTLPSSSTSRQGSVLLTHKAQRQHGIGVPRFLVGGLL